MMAGVRAALATVAITALGCAGDRDSTAVSHTAIVAGAVTDGDPAVVAIGGQRLGCQQVFAPRCTGTVIAPTAVLSAAHCVLDRRLGRDLEVMVGNDPAGAVQFHRVARVVIHPDYGIIGDAADLAILHLQSAVETAPAELAAASFLAVGNSVRLVGFGSTGPLGQPPGRKRTGQAVVTAVEELQFRIAADPAMSCDGDSGGPVLVETEGREVVAGVISRGDPGCAEFGINVRVDAFAAGFIEPELATSPAGPGRHGLWPGRSEDAPVVAEDQLCTAACATDGDCLDNLVCRLGPGMVMRCTVPGLLPGDLTGTCTSDDSCEERCVRVDADDSPDACRCYRACDAAPDPPSDNSGCSIGNDADTRGGWIGLILLVMIVLLAKRLT